MNHELYIRRCLVLAQRGASEASPNPMVGAVLVYNDRVIGEGWHERCGEAHAEVNCFDNVPQKFKHLIPDSTMYVSLEPCAHYGKTPPCANRIVTEGVKKVVICNKDPFEKVAGRGIEILDNAGITTITGILDEDGKELNKRFFHFHTVKRPYIILKWAQSADGYIAPINKARTQLSSSYSQTLVHRWRTEEDAILVGYNTALHDNPQLTARLWHGRQPLRIVMDRDLKLPKHLSLFDGSTPTWVVNNILDEETQNITYVKVSHENPIPDLLTRLYNAHKLSLFVEGGAALLNSFISLGLWDEARIFSTPTLLSDGIAATTIKNSFKSETFACGNDVLKVFYK